MRKTSWLLAALLAVVLLPAGLAAQQGTVTGRVIDMTTNEPLADVQVVLMGTTRGALTNENGIYRIESVEPGAYTVRATRIGYDGEDVRVVVAAGETQTVNLAIQPAAVSLDAVVVTATGTQKKRELANAVSNINADQVVEQAPVTDLSSLLTGRAAGVKILQNAGTTGANQRIRIRGATSVSLSNDPIIFIDGVRAFSSSDASSLSTGGQTTSALTNINPEEIESIEIIKGPSAATLYGTDAANGVIRITTKKGGAGGAPRWNLYAEGGRLVEDTEFPANFRGQTAEGARCLLFQVGLGLCEQAELLAFTPLEDERFAPFDDGDRQQFGASVAGGDQGAGYFLSGEYEQETGVLALPPFFREQAEAGGVELPDNELNPNSLEKVSIRANLNAEMGGNLRAAINTGYVTQELFLPQNDNNALGLLPSALLGNPFQTEDRQFGFGFLTPDKVFAIEVKQDVERFIGGANINWQPRDWFTGRATLGLDNTAQNDQRFVAPGRIPEFSSQRSGNRNTLRRQILNYTADIGGTAQFDVTEDVNSRTSVGVQYFREYNQFTGAFGIDLPPGSRSAGAAAEQFAGEGTSESITLGTFVEQQFGWRDRLYVTGALRSDDNSAFGEDFDVIVYPKFGTSFVAVDEQDDFFFPALNSLRLRAAWGAAGRAPGSTDALLFLQPGVVSVAGTDVPGVTFAGGGSLGNVALEPERSEEWELGLDAGFLGGRLGAELTYYDRTTEDLLVNRPLPPSLGTVSSRFENLGSVSNKGFEVAINALPISMRNVTWELNLTGSTNENELIELGLDVDSILFGPQRFQEGFPLGGFFGEEITFADENNNNIIEPGEITRADAATFIGPAFPETEASIQSTLTLFDVVRISGLLDYRGDFYNRNFTEEFRSRFTISRGLNDPSASLFEQARALQTITLGGNRSAEPFIEDASFWKLRELSFSLMIPDRFTSRFGATNGSLSLSGRNIATWTDYSGLDPEINQTATANFTTREFLTQPPVETWILRLNLGF